MNLRFKGWVFRPLHLFMLRERGLVTRIAAEHGTLADDVSNRQ